MVKCSTLEELIREARLLFEVAEESKVFIQRFDELWMEKVDVESLNEVNDRDKLFLVCTWSITKLAVLAIFSPQNGKKIFSFYRFMIMCEKQGKTCKIWYHGPCVKISKAKSKKIKKICLFQLQVI